MKHFFVTVSRCAFIISFILTIFLTPPVVAESAELMIGASKTNITPSVGTPLSGYGKLRGKATLGTHDPIYARSLALSKGKNTFVFLSLDLCLIDEKLRKTIYKKVNQEHPLRPEELIVFATHTHTGAGAIGHRFWERFIMGKFNKNVFDKLTSKAAEAALQSLRQRTKATAEFGSIRIDDLIENRMIPKLRYPQSLKILRFKDSKGNIIANLFSMAAHPTLFPADKLLFSADYPGALAKAFDNAAPGSTAIFINGAAADLRPHTPQHEDKLQRLILFNAVLAERAKQIPFKSISLKGPWKASLRRIKLPKVKVRAGRLTIPSLIGNRFFPRKIYFQSIRMGPLAFISVPGEISSEIGHEIEARVSNAGLTPIIVGYANDYMAYIIPRRYYHDRDQYEARVSFYGKNMDLFIQAQSQRLLEDILTTGEASRLKTPGSLDSTRELPVIKLRGSAYHRGFEEGRLMKDQIHQGTKQIFSYFRKELKVPIINRLIIHWVASRAWRKLEPYLSYDELEQIKGIADGADISLGKLKKIHAMPELFPTLCTNGAYWGEATQDSKLIAIRNLDWNREMRVFDLASVKYHYFPSGQSYANIGYSGFSGVLSGLNSEGISVGQIGATSEDQSLDGLGMPFLLQRVLRESASLEDAQEIFKRSDLTQGYNYVIADAIDKEAIVIEATHNHLAFFEDNDPKETPIDYAFQLDDAVFRGDPALDPTIRNLQWASKGKPDQPGLEAPGGSAYEIRYLKHGQLVQDHYGKITPQTAKYIAREIAPKTNIQSVVYHYPDFYVANAQVDSRAVDNTYHKININELGDSFEV